MRVYLHQLRWFGVLLFLVLLAGCFSPIDRLNRAQRLQKAGEYAAAIREYSAVLARVSEDRQQVIAQIALHIAECQWAKGEPKAALLSLQNALAADAENRGAHLRLAELMLAGGSPQAAIEQASWLLDRDSGNLDALTVLAQSYAALGEITPAQSVFERVLATDPARVGAALTLAQLYAANGDQQKARATLLRAARSRPAEAAPWLALARLDEEAGNTIAAEENYRKAVAANDARDTKLRLAQFLARASRIGEAEQLLTELDAVAPRVSTFRADFDLLLGRPSEALAKYESALQSNTGGTSRSRDVGLSPAAVAARLIEAELALADQEAERAGRLQHAQELLDRYKSQMDLATGESLQAEIALVAGDAQQAEQHAVRALQLAPESAAAHFVAGLVKHATGDAPAANLHWDAALERNPEFLPARQAVALRALANGDAQGAEEYIVPVVREEPANFEALCIYARALAAKEELAAAGLIARRAIAADPKSADPHLILAEIASEQKRWASAFIEYQQAILLEPNSPVAIAGLAKIYRKGRITRAMLRRMETVAANPPASASLMEIVGRLYADRGWQADAQRALHRAAKLDPTRTTPSTALALNYVHHGNQRAAADSLAMASESAAELIAGLRAMEGKDVDAAIRSYESAVRQGERSGAAANNLAWIYAERGVELDRAMELAELARRLAPRNPAVLDTVGFVQLQRREYSQAVATLKDAVELALSPAGKSTPADVMRQLKVHLTEAYMRSGQPQPAATLKKSLP